MDGLWNGVEHWVTYPLAVLQEFDNEIIQKKFIERRGDFIILHCLMMPSLQNF